MHLYTAVASILLMLASVELLTTFTYSAILYPIRSFNRLLSQFHFVEGYGIFAVMTLQRPEIVFEGSNDGKTWLPYEMKYQISDLHKAPPWVAPHMPRLPWRLWFAAMVPAEENPWVLGLVNGMLHNTPCIMQFFAVNPFPDKPPRYIRAWVYNYHFTNWSQKEKTGDWWWRDNQREYLTPIQLREESSPLEG